MQKEQHTLSTLVEELEQIKDASKGKNIVQPVHTYSIAGSGYFCTCKPKNGSLPEVYRHYHYVVKHVLPTFDSPFSKTIMLCV